MFSLKYTSPTNMTNIILTPLSKMSFLSHGPSLHVDKKISVGQNNIFYSFFCDIFAFISVHLMRLIRYNVEYKLNKKARAKF